MEERDSRVSHMCTYRHWFRNPSHSSPSWESGEFEEVLLLIKLNRCNTKWYQRGFHCRPRSAHLCLVSMHRVLPRCIIERYQIHLESIRIYLESEKTSGGNTIWFFSPDQWTQAHTLDRGNGQMKRPWNLHLHRYLRNWALPPLCSWLLFWQRRECPFHHRLCEL